jgi:peptide/nickel transport system permease protein
MIRRLLRNTSMRMGLVVLVPVLACVIAPGLLSPHDPNATLAQPLLSPSSRYLLGTDEVGRDLLSRLIWSARTDVGIGLAATSLAAVVGTCAGLCSGFRGGVVDTIVMRLTDVLLSFPSILLALFVVAVFGHSDLVLVAALAGLFLGSWVRLARGLALSLRDRAYVEAAEVSGARTWHIMRWHLLPNARGPLVVGFAMTAAYGVVAGATLSFLGLGIQPPNASWGVMLQSSFAYVFSDPLYGVLPGLCVTLVAFAFTWIADGVDEVVGGAGATQVAFPGLRLRREAAVVDAATPS